MDKIRGIISETDYIEFSREFEKERRELEEIVAHGEQELIDIEAKMQIGDNHAEILEQYRHLDKLTCEAMEVLIDRVVVHKRNQGEKSPKIEIYWNF
ncbi:MAG: DUF4368 domain-containing protein [Oscillospiraceae bacterium]|nr:DUF4368 domain-containing protein [Oscillospiraceae bacterium]